MKKWILSYPAFMIFLSLLVMGGVPSFLYGQAMAQSGDHSFGPLLSEVRLDAPLYSMSLVPVTHQRGVPLCFAFAATQMVDAYRTKIYQKNLQENGEKKTFNEMKEEFRPSSAFATAVWTGYETGLSYEQTLNSGGFLCEAMENLLKQGHCEEKKTRKIFQSLKSYARTDVEKEQDLEAGNKFLTDNKVYKSPTVESMAAGMLPAGTTDFQHGNSNDLRLNILKNLVDKDCEQKEDLSSLQLSCREIRRKGPRPERGELLLKMVETEMNKDREAMPVGIKYCANFLDKGPLYRAAQKSVKDESQNPHWVWRNDCLVHYSLIIGERLYENGHKQFLIRDSYGPDCGGNSLHPSFKCERGNIWVDKDVLLPNILEVNFLLGPENT